MRPQEIFLPKQLVATCDELSQELLCLFDNARAPVLALAAQLVPILEGEEGGSARENALAAALTELAYSVPNAIEAELDAGMLRIAELIVRGTKSESVSYRFADEIAEELSKQTLSEVRAELALASQSVAQAEFDMSTATQRGALHGGAVGAAIGGVGSKVFFPKQDWRGNAAWLGLQGAAAGINVYHTDAEHALDSARSTLSPALGTLTFALDTIGKAAWALIDPSGRTARTASLQIFSVINDPARGVYGFELEAIQAVITTLAELRYCAAPSSGFVRYLFSIRRLTELFLTFSAFIATAIAIGYIRADRASPSDQGYGPLGVAIGIFSALLWWVIYREWIKWSNRFNATSAKRSEVLTLAATLFRETNELPGGQPIATPRKAARPHVAHRSRLVFMRFLIVQFGFAWALQAAVRSLSH